MFFKKKKKKTNDLMIAVMLVTITVLMSVIVWLIASASKDLAYAPVTGKSAQLQHSVGDGLKK